MKDSRYKYDYSNYSDRPTGFLYNVKSREQKARKILAILDDYYYNGELNKLSLLDIGCSTGLITYNLSKRFGKVVGIDLDKSAISYAKNFRGDNLKFYIQDGTKINIPGNSFDIVICNHIYEHVHSPEQLISEVYRVLKPGGICYFAAGNRWQFMEQHYRLPFLSIIPKPAAHLYLRILKKGKYYYENHLTLWKLHGLVSRFEIIDYSLKIIEDPQKYFATDMVKDNSLKQKIALMILRRFYWACPTYIWLLCKKKE